MNKRKICLFTFLKQTIQWGIAVISGFLIVNICMFAYERPVSWLDTPNGVSAAIRNPGTIIVHGKEGYSVSRVDKNGFLNSGSELDDRYILLLGSSFTQGKEMPEKKRFYELVNSHFQKTPDLMAAYNIACDGHFLPTQIKHFKAVADRYEDASCYVIEIGDVEYPVDSLSDGLNQAEYRTSDSAVYFENPVLKERIRIVIKEYFPLISMIKSQIETVSRQSAEPVYEIDKSEYSSVINKGLNLMRSETDKPIVFVYHPSVRINPDGSMSVVSTEYYDIFKTACDNNGIDIIDCGDAFLKGFNDNRKVPYGFSNTSYPAGHLNSVGHAVLADEIIRYIEARGILK